GGGGGGAGGGEGGSGRAPVQCQSGGEKGGPRRWMRGWTSASCRFTGGSRRRRRRPGPLAAPAPAGFDGVALDRARGPVILRAMLRLPWRAGVRALIAGLVALAVTLPLDPVLHDFVFRHVNAHEVRLLANGVTLLGTAWAGGG